MKRYRKEWQKKYLFILFKIQEVLNINKKISKVMNFLFINPINFDHFRRC